MQSFSQSNGAVRYSLCVIHYSSMFGWIVSLKDKSGIAVADAFKNILAVGRKPEKIWVDKGKEICHKEVKALRVLSSIATENE
jgi:hypothetical protein